MAETAATKPGSPLYTATVTLPAEKIDGRSLLSRLENVEQTLEALSDHRDDFELEPEALELPRRELRRIRVGLALLLGVHEDDIDGLVREG